MRDVQPSSSPGNPARAVLAALLLLCAVPGLSACGGSDGTADGTGRGLQVISFDRDSIDTVPLNAILHFEFSEALDPTSVTPASVQLREGPAFGRSVEGTFHVEGAMLLFVPRLPGLCDLSDGAFKGATPYRVQLVGHPEEFSLRNTRGQPLESTVTFEFKTRADNDPARFEDAVPATAPRVVESTPTNGAEAVGVAASNRIVLQMSENLDPCSVSEATVRFHIYQFGHKDTTVLADGGTGNPTGFATVAGATSDQTPMDPYTWGSPPDMPGVVTPPTALKILSRIQLVQGFESTQILITPSFGRFPENSLIVAELTFGVEDFGGDPLKPFVLSFTTENTPAQTSTYVMDVEGETPFNEALSTADVDTARSPSRVQGYLLFAGDGDNGANPNAPTLPQSDAPTCGADYQNNDASPDDFDPSADVLLDTGSTLNLCPNATDGSLAVVWEFKTFRVRNGITVRVVGKNPAIFLVQGEVVIENGGRVLVRGDGQAGSPRGDGGGNANATTTAAAAGGVGVAGGGDGGTCLGGTNAGSARYSGHGAQGYFHPTPNGPVSADFGVLGAGGAGHGNTSCYWTTQTTNNRNTPSGGGGGHAAGGADGVANGSGNAPTQVDLAFDGAGGASYGDTGGRMLKPEAGSGGGAGSELRPFTGNVGRGPGGGGGAGGGFIDLTSGGSITVLGTIDAGGGDGGSSPGANFNPNYTYNPGTGGGGGGSGGGIRLLTPQDIVFDASTVLTAAGGAGGPGGATQGNPATPALNPGGNGGVGRITLEDSDSVITGIGSANVLPAEGDTGFYRGVFDTLRFKGGGLSPSAITGIFGVGPFNPQYLDPRQTYGVAEDFVVGVPVGTSPGTGKTAILIEAKGYDLLPDGSPDELGVVTPPTAWHTVGYFTDSGVDTLPTWHLGQPPVGDISTAVPPVPPSDNAWAFPGIGNLSDREFLQLRITVYLNADVGASDAGPYLDRFDIRFDHDQ